MSSKFHRQQQKAQWSAAGTRVSPEYVVKLKQLTNSTVPENFKAIASSLTHFCSLQNSYTELEALKEVCALVTALSRSNSQSPNRSNLFQAAARLILELLFFANSKPLHRQILAWCKGLPADKFATAMPGLVKLVNSAVAVSDAQGSDMQPISLAEPLLSLLECKPFQLPLRECSISVTRCLSDSMHDIIKAAAHGAHIPPSVMHSAQDAIAAIYYLLQLHGSFMAASQPDGHEAICAAAEAMITSLKGSALAREAMSSAAVALHAAAVLPDVPPLVSAENLALGLFWPAASGMRLLSSAASTSGIVAQHLAQRGTSISQEMQQFSFYGRVCAMKGLLQALPKEVLCSSLHLSPTDAPPASLQPSEAQPSRGRDSDSKTLSTLPLGTPQTAGRIPSHPVAQATDEMTGPQALHVPQTDPEPTATAATAVQDSATPHQLADSSESEALQRSAGKPETATQSTAGTAGSAHPAGTAGSAHTAGKAWLLLSDCALPACCAAVQQSTDAHHKFHAVSALAHCLARIKQCLQDHAAAHSAPDPTPLHPMPPSPNPSAQQAQALHRASGPSSADDPAGMPILAVTLGFEEEEQPAEATANSAAASVVPPTVSGAMRAEVMHLVWGNFEDSLIQTVKQVQAAFETLLDILELQTRLQTSQQRQYEAAAELQSFLCSTASTLMAVGSHRKGRYIPLAALVRRIGARQMLTLQTDILKQTLIGMQDDAVGSAAAALLTQLLLHLRSDMIQDSGSREEGLAAWRQVWIPVLLQGLSAPDEHLRHRVSLYAVPVPLALDQASVLPLLQQVVQIQAGEAAASDSQVATLVAILKTARQMGLYQDLSHVEVPGEGSVAVPAALLRRAVASSTESLQVDALQLACVHPRGTSLPGNTELDLVKQAVVLGLRCTSTSMRNKWTGLLPKLLRRIFMSVHAALNRQRAAVSKTGRGPHVEADLHASEDLQGVYRQEAFMQWLSQTLLASLYPGAPYERKYHAMLLLNSLLEVWNAPHAGSKSYTKPISAEDNALISNAGTLVIGKYQFQAFCEGFFDAQTTQVLLGAAVDSWDRMRDGAVSCLMQLPAPLPGLETPSALLPHLRWACQLICSPRVRESDAGSRLLCMVYEKYVLDLGWHIQLFPTCTAALPPSDATKDETSAAALVMLQSLATWLQADIQAGDKDLYQSCRHSLAHGVLLLLRYLAPLVPWHAAAAAVDQGQAVAIRPWLQGLLQLLKQAAELVLQPLSKPQESNIGAEDVDADDMEAGEADLEGSELAPQAQVILTGCWLTMKEISLLLGTIASCAPLPGNGDDKSPHVLEAQQLAEVGQRFVHILLTIKHNGAIDKTQAGFTALVQRMLLEASPQLNSLPQQWLHHLLAHMQRPGQSRDDIVRRSAGLPAAFVAVFAAEPTGHPKTLLQHGMRELLGVAADESQEEPWARVHAINVLRLTFNDKNLANDVSGFFAEGLQVAILAMGSAAWEVRNAASLIFTALIIRMLGFRNLIKGESARRAITGAEFFNRYPSLHNFLLIQLQAASQQLQQGATLVHPSLFPVLALLSRLRPSLHNQSTMTDDPLSPAHFSAAVQKCATASHMAVRQLAARALAPLVPPEELAPMLLGLLTHAARSHDPRGSSPNLVHGCLLQATLLLNINAQTLDTVALVQTLPALWSVTPLMHPSNPCAPLRYGTTLLAAAVIELPELPHTASLAGWLSRIRQLCWLAVATSCGSYGEHTKQLPDNNNNNNNSSSSSITTEARISTGNSAGALLQCDDADPMTSLWLKHATLLLFGHQLQKAIEQAAANEEWESCGLREEEVRTALQSRNYDVRAACLKACIQRRASGEVMPAWLPALLKRRLTTERHHKVLRRLLQLLTAIPDSAAKPQAGSHASRQHQPNTAAERNGASQPHSGIAHNTAQSARLHDAEHQTGSAQASRSLPLNDSSARQADEVLLVSPSLPVQTASTKLADPPQPSSLRGPEPAAASSECSSSSLIPSSYEMSGTAAAGPGLSSASTPSSDRESDTTADAGSLTQAVQQYEQIQAIMTQARHPSVNREALHSLGIAMHCIIATLVPEKDQTQPAMLQERQMNGVDSLRRQQLSHGLAAASDSTSPHYRIDLSQAQPRSSALQDAQLGHALHEMSLSDSGPAQFRGSGSVSLHQAQNSTTTTSDEADCKASPAQSQGPQQAAHRLVDGFVPLVSRCSEAQQFDDIRLAAANALASSGLLSCQGRADRQWQSSCSVTGPATQAWFTVIAMMEDEDIEVRHAATSAAAAALNVLSPGSVSHGAHVELLLRETFHMLGSCCMHLPAVQHYMIGLIHRPHLSSPMPQPMASGDRITQLPSSPISRHASIMPLLPATGSDSVSATAAPDRDSSDYMNAMSLPQSEMQGAAGSSRQPDADETCGSSVSQSQLQNEGDSSHHSSPDGVRARSVSDSEKHSTADGSHQRQPEAVRRLFDKELDNHHEEKLLLAQLAARELRRAVGGDSRNALVKQSEAWAHGSLQDLCHLTGTMQQPQTSDSWQGEVTNHDNLFQPVYHMLLGLHTAAFCCLSARKPLPFGLALLHKAAEGLSRVALHPVLTAMLASTMTLWEASRPAESQQGPDGVDCLQWSYSFLSGEA